jgi:two-component system, OmpR family, response regulator
MNEKILIVDDEKDVCEALKECLSREGYEVEVCYMGADALALLNEKKYDLVLIDIRLEGRISGIDLIKRAVEVSPKPAIVVESATPKKQLEEILKKEGLLERVDRILEKPSDLRLDHFIHFIHQVLSKGRG